MKMKVSSTGLSKTSWDLMLISFISLFLELAIIRWLSAEIRIFAYFKNLPLMAAFLGFGIGFMLHQKSEQLFFWFPRLICCLVVIIAGASGFGITHVIFLDPRQYFLLGTGFGDHAVQSIPSLLQTAKALFVIISVFFLVMITFATLASKVGELLNKEKSLVGYSINVAGSLTGILGFSLVSYLQWSPWIWLILIFLPLSYFYRHQARYAGIYFLASIAFTIYANIVNPAIWSPYYRISIETISSPNKPKETHLYINYDGFQVIQDLSESYVGRFPEEVQRVLNRHYNIPYFLSKRRPDSVLILGGGTGNDAAAALRNGASLVDVVEIDPVIARIGQELHPEKPYNSKKVSLHVDDARSFLQRTRRKYDLVIFATLDSHTVFSSLSSLRLDNFVFTKESIQSARERLNPGGGIAINFFNAKPWLSQRHFNTLKVAMGTLPLTYASSGNQEVIVLAGDCFDAGRELGSTDYQLVDSQFTSLRVEPTSDDWPFLFLEKRGIPLHYVLPLFFITALAFIPLAKSHLKVKDLDWHLFFMGAAFLLLESKAVTTLALIFGSTWIVNSVVIGSILLTILVANLLNSWLSHLSFLILYTGLLAALVANFLFSFTALNRFDRSIQLLTSSVIIGLPIFFAAIIFAKAFAVVQFPSLALASNLLGGLVGGLLEYVDMLTGLKWLNLVALFLYLVSSLFLFLRPRDYQAKIADPVGIHFKV
jgi:SAM-dependent methyltransferase